VKRAAVAGRDAHAERAEVAAGRPIAVSFGYELVIAELCARVYSAL
jgi:hypothetical protein